MLTFHAMPSPKEPIFSSVPKRINFFCLKLMRWSSFGDYNNVTTKGLYEVLWLPAKATDTPINLLPVGGQILGAPFSPWEKWFPTARP